MYTKSEKVVMTHSPPTFWLLKYLFHHAVLSVKDTSELEYMYVPLIELKMTRQWRFSGSKSYYRLINSHADVFGKVGSRGDTWIVYTKKYRHIVCMTTTSLKPGVVTVTTGKFPW